MITSVIQTVDLRLYNERQKKVVIARSVATKQSPEIATLRSQ